ncbi:centromere protein K isoform X2 [Nerophis ophidion]|uniref:centromere protein K isoform X2 n=1 Tax=Nerophis ophidion TaxID=159077 RepID=UPI002ADFED73|nr:centromere protein K isoform X2 [Nerophis ophidion]
MSLQQPASSHEILGCRECQTTDESEVLDDVPADNAESKLSKAAEEELMIRCEQQFEQLEKLQNEIILCEPDLSENPQEQSVNRLLATEAELDRWHTVEPQLLAENPEVLLKAGKEEMRKLCSELEMVLSCVEAKRDNLRETKKLEEKWLEEKRQVLESATSHANLIQEQNEKLSEHSVLQDTKDKIQKMKVYQEKLMESLGEILEKHIPPPVSANKKNIPDETNEDLISLSDILELLMNKVLNTSHDPYVTIDSTFWPPYVEMLLRYGIAVRHHENYFKIRLETFF